MIKYYQIMKTSLFDGRVSEESLIKEENSDAWNSIFLIIYMYQQPLHSGSYKHGYCIA